MSRPKVIVHFAITSDGKVSTARLTPARFTSPADKHRLLEIRALADALMVGRGTAERDQMTMGLPDETLRQARLAKRQSEYPLRVLISNSGRIPLDLPVFKHAFSAILIYSTRQMSVEIRRQLQHKAQVFLHPGKRLDVRWVLEHLRQHHGVRTLVCEGGPTLVRALAECSAIDEIFLTVAAKLFGGHAAPGLLGPPGAFLPSTRTFRLVEMHSNPASTGECYVHFRSRNSRPRNT
jgi:2,5-diamino-6-(ribosylamino)-4(3H)-pyrimidinone 5'-phosphate reductase